MNISKKLIKCINESKDIPLKLKNYFETIYNIDDNNELPRFLTVKNYKGDIMASYLPAGKQAHFNSNDEWALTNRTKSKLGKAFRLFLIKYGFEDISDKDIEILNNAVKSYYTINYVDDYKFKTYSGSEIADVYNSFSISNDSGTLLNSCMNDKYSSYFDIYVKNDHKIKMLTLFDNCDEMVGRALIWEDTYMDRIYGTDVVIGMFKQYARDNNLWHKCEQSYNNSEFVKDNNIVHDIVINDLKTEFDYYPYLDTFKYLESSDCGYLKTCGDEDLDMVLDCTNGGYSGGDRKWSDYHDCYIDDDNAEYSQYEQDWLDINSNDVVYVEDHCEYAIREHVTYIHCYDAYYIDTPDDVVYSDYIDEYITINNAVEINDEWYPEDDTGSYVYCECIDDYREEDECISNQLGEYYPEDFYVECEDGEIREISECVEHENEWYTKEQLEELLTKLN